MGCASCNKNKLTNNSPLTTVPYNATDTYILSDGDVHRMTPDDWDGSKHKVLFFTNNMELPECEWDGLNDYAQQFSELNCDIYLASSEAIHVLKDAIDNSSLPTPNYKVLSSYLMPNRMGVFKNGRCKNATVVITQAGEVTINEHIDGVARSIEETYQAFNAFVENRYCL